MWLLFFGEQPQRVGKYLVDEQAAGRAFGLGELGQRQAENTVTVGGGNVRSVDPNGVKASGIGTESAFTADVIALLIFLLEIRVPLCIDGQGAFVEVDVDIVLVKAGQIGLKQVILSLVPDVGAETGGGTVREEGTLQLIKAAERVVGMAFTEFTGVRY